MQYIIIVLLSSIFFSGCSTMTPIQIASDSTSQFGGGIYTGTEIKGIEVKDKEVYRVFHRGSTGFTPLSAVRKSAEKRADTFCKAKNKLRTTVSERHSNPPHILGNWPRIELLFVCNGQIQKINDSNSKDDKYEKLSKIKKLYDDKVLTKEEFLIEKKKILEITTQ